MTSDDATDYDAIAATQEGWAIFECNDGFLRIQRLDCPNDADPGLPKEPMFAGDGAAISYVRVRAAAGSSLHAAALTLHEAEFWYGHDSD